MPHKPHHILFQLSQNLLDWWPFVATKHKRQGRAKYLHRLRWYVLFVSWSALPTTGCAANNPMQGAQQETTELGEPSCVGYSEGTFAALFEPVVSSSPQILAGLPSVVSTDGDVFYVSVGQVNVDH